MKSLLLSVLFVTAVACSTATSDHSALQRREWRLVQIGGAAATTAGAATPTLRFGADGRMTGNTGCNSTGGAYTVDGDRLTFGALVMTKRACAASAANRLERTFAGALQATRSYRVTEARLELLDGSGNVVAQFE